MKTILVPTDLSPSTNNALSVAVSLARLYQAEVVLLHSVMYAIPVSVYAEAPTITADYQVEENAIIEKEARKTLLAMAQNPAYADVKITPTLLTNGLGLVHNVTHRPADLIVMASTGASGLEEALMGSNAEIIVRHAHCPVLVVKSPVAHFRPENIVCAVDVDDELNHPHHYPFQMGENGINQFLYVRTPTDSRDPEGVREWVNHFASARGITEFTFIMRPAKTVPDGIICYANDVHADLIVVFTHGHTGLRHLISGSVAEDVLNHAEMPVLIMRA